MARHVLSGVCIGLAVFLLAYGRPWWVAPSVVVLLIVGIRSGEIRR